MPLCDAGRVGGLPESPILGCPRGEVHFDVARCSEAFYKMLRAGYLVLQCVQGAGPKEAGCRYQK